MYAVVDDTSGSVSFIRERTTGQLVAASVSSTDRSAYYNDTSYSRVAATDSTNTLIAWVSTQLGRLNATGIPGEWPTEGTRAIHDTENVTGYAGYYVDINVYRDTDTLEWDMVFVQPINCAVGYEVDSSDPESATECKVCIAPLTSLGGASACDRCIAGFYRLDLTETCRKCPSGGKLPNYRKSC